MWVEKQIACKRQSVSMFYAKAILNFTDAGNIETLYFSGQCIHIILH